MMRVARLAFAGILSCVTLLPAQTSEAPKTLQLTMAEAEKIAIENNPRISIARLEELMQRQIVRETRSPEFPQAAANITSVRAEDASRVTAGFLNNPTLYTRAAAGVSVSQLITDFGRTRHLVKSAQFNDEAQKNDLAATHAQILLAVDRAFLQALIEQRLLRIAEQTVTDRQALDDEIATLTRAKLKSTLDQSMADSELAIAELNLVDARTEAGNSIFDLQEILGLPHAVELSLDDKETNLVMPLTLDAQQLLGKALAERPDFLALQKKEEAAKQMQMAEHDLARPSIQAMAAGGGAPVRADAIAKPWYGAAGINVSIPLFTGDRFSARAREAELAAMESQARVLELQQRIERDLRKTLANTQAAYQKIAVTEQILERANLSLQLASTRYRLGLSNMVELNDAENAQIAAQIGAANARYSYRIWVAELNYQTGE